MKIGDIWKFIMVVLSIYQQMKRFGGVVWLERLSSALSDLEKAQHEEEVFNATARVSELLRNKRPSSSS